MRGAIQHFQDAAHDFSFALDRLVRVGIGSDRDHSRFVILRSEFFFQKLRRIGFGEQFRFEIETRREAEIGVGRPRKTVDAAVLTSPIGIDRAVETDIRGIIAGDDLARGIERDGGLERRQLLEALPTIVEGNASLGLETAAGVRLRAAAAPPFVPDGDPKLRKCGRRTRRFGGRLNRRVLERVWGCSAHGVTIARNENKSRT